MSTGCQKDINLPIRLFISHGGAGGLQESICHKTPILGVPIMNDQNTNMFMAKSKGFGEVIPWTELTEEMLMRRLTEMMTTDDYQTAVDTMSDLVMDQPLHPLERLCHPHPLALARHLLCTRVTCWRGAPIHRVRGTGAASRQRGRL